MRQSNGLWYERKGDCYRHYLQEHKKAIYTTLLTSGKSDNYLADIEKQAQERFERRIEDMKQAQNKNITEQLKAENALEWGWRMNNIRACAREIVNEEIIYC